MKSVSLKGEPARIKGRGLALLLALSFGVASAVPARADTSGDAEKLLRLDIMLMVTGLRCRHTSDDFQGDYGRFTTRHMSLLKGASADLRTGMARRFGEFGAKRAMDRMRVTMANQYGNGHPWLDCGQLKMVASNLSKVDGRATLVEAADQLLQHNSTGQLALAGE